MALKSKKKPLCTMLYSTAAWRTSFVGFPYDQGSQIWLEQGWTVKIMATLFSFILLLTCRQLVTADTDYISWISSSFIFCTLAYPVLRSCEVVAYWNSSWGGYAAMKKVRGIGSPATATCSPDASHSIWGLGESSQEVSEPPCLNWGIWHVFLYFLFY